MWICHWWRRISFIMRLADKLKYAFPGREPQSLGVAGQIIPWNFPLLMAAWKLAPALACGNTVVLKPAETTSITSMQLAKIFQEAELPDGVVNIVTARERRAALVNHPELDKVALRVRLKLGSHAKTLAERTGERPAPKLTLELGGKAANIVSRTRRLISIEGLLRAFISIRAMLLRRLAASCAGGDYRTVVQKWRDRIKTLRVGNPLDKNTDIGAINSKPQLERFARWFKVGQRKARRWSTSHCTRYARELCHDIDGVTWQSVAPPPRLPLPTLNQRANLFQLRL